MLPSRDGSGHTRRRARLHTVDGVDSTEDFRPLRLPSVPDRKQGPCPRFPFNEELMTNVTFKNETEPVIG